MKSEPVREPIAAPVRARTGTRPRVAIVCLVLGILLILIGFGLAGLMLLASLATPNEIDRMGGLVVGGLGVHLVLLGCVSLAAGLEWRTGNAFAAPSADDVPVSLSIRLLWFLFSFRGRVSRVHFWLMTGSVGIAGAGFALLLGADADVGEQIVGIVNVALLWPAAEFYVLWGQTRMKTKSYGFGCLLWAQSGPSQADFEGPLSVFEDGQVRLCLNYPSTRYSPAVSI